MSYATSAECHHWAQFHTYALYPHMSVADNMSFGLRMTHCPKAEIAEKVPHAAAILKFEELLQRKPAQLSGGQHQRVAIGRAIVRVPKVFLFDEPLSNLDAELRVQMRVEIAKLHKMLGNTMIYVTHDQTEALTMADRIVVLRAGQVEQNGRPLDLYKNPDNAFVAGFIGSPRMNFVNAIAQGGNRFTLSGTDVDVPVTTAFPAGTEVKFGIRPEHFDAAQGAGLRVVVDVIEQLGSTSYLHGATSSGEAIVTQRKPGQEQAGERVTLRFNPEDVRLFDRDGKRIR